MSAEPKYPITDAAEKRFTRETGMRNAVNFEDMREVEERGQGLRDHLHKAPVHRLDESAEAFIERYKEWYREKHWFVDRFDALHQETELAQ